MLCERVGSGVMEMSSGLLENMLDIILFGSLPISYGFLDIRLFNVVSKSWQPRGVGFNPFCYPI